MSLNLHYLDVENALYLYTDYPAQALMTPKASVFEHKFLTVNPQVNSAISLMKLHGAKLVNNIILCKGADFVVNLPGKGVFPVDSKVCASVSLEDPMPLGFS